LHVILEKSLKEAVLGIMRWVGAVKHDAEGSCFSYTIYMEFESVMVLK